MDVLAVHLHALLGVKSIGQCVNDNEGNEAVIHRFVPIDIGVTDRTVVADVYCRSLTCYLRPWLVLQRW